METLIAKNLILDRAAANEADGIQGAILQGEALTAEEISPGALILAARSNGERWLINPNEVELNGGANFMSTEAAASRARALGGSFRCP